MNNMKEREKMEKKEKKAFDAKNDMNEVKATESSMNFNNVNHTAEDWDGLKNELQASNLPQKDMIIRIVESNTPGDKRNHEMKNMTKVFNEIKETMLPKLRRAAV